jgi:tetratricopeptide (TPR) repeat protein
MKHFLMIIGCLFAFSVMGQKEVVSAYNANKDGDYRAASTYIEQAILVEKSKTKDKTWRYRGEIYLNISRDSSLDIEYPNALRLAMESYLKAQEFDIKERYVDEIRIGLAQVQLAANSSGITHYNDTSFDLAAEVARTFDIVDTMAIYNAALCYEKADLMELAIERYKECAEIEYQVPNVFLFISTLYRSAENDEEALKVLQEARISYPREQSLIIEELNIYLTNKDFERADLIRERLEDIGIVFKDSAEGTTWEMTDKNTSLMSVSKNSKKS